MTSAPQVRPPGADDTTAPASVHVEEAAEVTRIRLVGEIDVASDPDLTRARERALARRLPVQVDSAGVTFMDSTGVSFLALLAARAEVDVTLVAPPPIVRFLVRTTGIAPMVRVDPPDDPDPTGTS